MLSINWLDLTIFLSLVVFSMGIDHYLHKDDKPVTLKSAVNWSIFWVAISMLYAGFLWWHHGVETASLFISGYALEKVLSVDNLFVFSAIFAWFGVPNQYRHRVLYWGVIGAIVFRLIFVLVGAGLLQAFGSYAEILFAVLVGYAAVMMLKGGDDDDEEVDYENHVANRIVHKFFPVIPKLYGHNFFVNREQAESVLAESAEEERKSVTEWLKTHGGKSALFATPLLVCAAVVELSDVMFAFDSVPAVIAVSKEPLIIYSSMLFAILGLRTLYFVLEALKEMLHHLEKAIIALLFFIAIKLALSASLHLTGFGYDISPTVSLAVVIITLSVGVIASLLHKTEENKGEKPLKGSGNGESSGLVFASSDVSELKRTNLSEEEQHNILNSVEANSCKKLLDASDENSSSLSHSECSSSSSYSSSHSSHSDASSGDSGGGGD
jgi:integral membrane protein, TerC family